MLSHIKTRLASLQEEISASVKHYSGSGIGDVQDGLVDPRNLIKVNPTAGSELLDYYESIWAELHENNEKNVLQSVKCDRMIEKLYLELEKQWKDITTLQSLLTQIPKINQEVEKAMNTLGDLESLFSDVEVSLLALEDTIDTRELQEKQLDQRFQLAIYQERRQAEYNELTSRLHAEHVKKRQEAELQNCLIAKERQSVFHQKFQEDMAEYKAGNGGGSVGGLLKVPSNIHDHDVSLETVDLDEDEDDNSLEAFLEDVSPLPRDENKILHSSSNIDIQNPSTAIPPAMSRTESLYYTPDTTLEKLSSINLDDD